MPGGKNKITPADGKRFSSSYQPERRRGTDKVMRQCIKDQLNGTELFVTGIDINTGQRTTVLVTSPSAREIIHALLNKGKKGNMSAIKLIFDRIDGR